LPRRKNESEFAAANVVTAMSEKDLENAGASERAELYYAAHPGSPSAVRCPRIFARSGVWVALLGRNMREGITGFGPNIEAALRAFDRQYLSVLRPPEETRIMDQAA
jgi:peptidoglycan hydrolase-like protein with peptidoglycan-binding domain